MGAPQLGPGVLRVTHLGHGGNGDKIGQVIRELRHELADATPEFVRLRSISTRSYLAL